MKKPYKSNIKAIKDDVSVFEIGSVKNDAQSTHPLLSIADHMQMKYNNEVEEAMRTLMTPTFMVLGVDKRDHGYGQ